MASEIRSHIHSVIFGEPKNQFNQTALKSNLTDFLFIENVKANLSSISKRQSVIFGAAEPFTLNIDGQMMSYISNDNDVADPNLTLN